MRKVKIIISGIFFLLAVFLLVFFPEINVTSNGKIPAGTIISWLAVVTYSMFWYYISPDYLNTPFFRNLKRLKDIHFLLALLWGFFSALLAGNWRFSFQNQPIRFDLWIGFTVFIVVAPFLLLIIFGVRKLISKNK